MLFAFAIASENDEPSLRKSRQISFGGGDPEDLPPGFSNGKRKNNKNRGGNRFVFFYFYLPSFTFFP